MVRVGTDTVVAVRTATMLLAAAFLLGNAGCGSRPPWQCRFGEQAFVHNAELYSIRYADDRFPLVLSEEWALGGWLWNGGSPRGPIRGGRWWGRMTIDDDQDGRDDVITDAPLWDVYYVHRETGSVIGIRTYLLGTVAEQREVRGLLHGLRAGFSGSHSFAWAGGDWWAAGHSTTTSTRVLQEGPLHRGDAAAYGLTFEVFDVNERRFDPESRGSVVRWFGFRPQGLVRGGGERRPGPGRHGLVVVSYAARTEYFDRHIADFEQMIARLDCRTNPAVEPGAAPALRPRRGAPAAYEGNPPRPEPVPVPAPPASAPGEPAAGVTAPGTPPRGRAARPTETLATPR